jgi:hypothetical protein
MTQHYYPVAHMSYEQQQAWQQRHDMHLLLNAAKTGALIGATGAAALNLHRMRSAEANWQQALTNTAKVGLTAGVATAAATAVGRMFVRYPALSMAATFATGTAVMYVLSEQCKEPGHE